MRMGDVTSAREGSIEARYSGQRHACGRVTLTASELGCEGRRSRRMDAAGHDDTTECADSVRTVPLSAEERIVQKAG